MAEPHASNDLHSDGTEAGNVPAQDVFPPPARTPGEAQQSLRGRVRVPSEKGGVAGVFQEVGTVEDALFHLAERTLVDALHLTGRVATVAISETTHVLGSAVRGVMHVLTRALPKDSELREMYTMAEAAEELLPEAEEIAPFL